MSDPIQVLLIEELRIEAKLVPNRRGRLYDLAADEIEDLKLDVKKLSGELWTAVNTVSYLRDQIATLLNVGK